MNRYILFLVVMMFVPCMLRAQDGKILSKEIITISKAAMKQVGSADPQLLVALAGVSFYRITYLSDSLKITGFIAEPKAKGRYPCIIANRGGNRDFGKWDLYSIATVLGRMCSWNYVVVASQYRGADEGEGKDEFGGEDLHDVFNLVPLLAHIPSADTARIGMYGVSRGGMMTYLSLKKSCRFKAAVAVSGIANLTANIADRPEMEENVLAQLVPLYWSNKSEALRSRSVVYWADSLCKGTPLLILHGSADWRVRASESLELVQKLYAYQHPVRFILYEGGDHGLSEFKGEMFAEIERHFNQYLRDLKALPELKLHGK